MAVKPLKFDQIELLGNLSESQFVELAKSHGLYLEPKKEEFTSCAWTIKDGDEITPESPFLIKPLMKQGWLCIMAAYAKVGKTLFASDIALMTACGELIGDILSAPNPSNILYIDTEMPGNEVKHRITKLARNFKNQENLKKNFRYINVLNFREKLNLLTIKDQKWVEDEIRGAKLIVFDNLGGLLPYGVEKIESCWEPFSNWLKYLVSLGITVLVVHHLNKEGKLRGSGKIIDDVDLAIELRRPEGCPRNKTIIEFHITHARYLYGNQLDPFIFEYVEENKVIRRIVKTGDYDLDHGKSLVSEEEIAEHGLSALHVEMLNAARDPKIKHIWAGMFKPECKSRGKSASSITSSLNYLFEIGLLEKHGSRSGMKYTLPGVVLPGDINKLVD